MSHLRLPIAAEDLGVWLAGVALAVLLGTLSWIGKGWVTPIAVVAVLLVGWHCTRVFGVQVGLVVLLILTTAIDRFTFPAGPVALRAEHIAALAALAAVLISAARTPRLVGLRPNAAEAFLAAWFACNLVSSFLVSPDRRLSAKIISLFAVCALGLVLPRRLLAGQFGEQRLPIVVRWLLITFATEGAYGTIAYLLHVLGPTIGLSPNAATGYLSAYGTLWEPNVLGSYMAAGIIGWAYLGPRRFSRTWVGIALCVGGAAASLTRAAWVAVVVVGAIGLVLPRIRQRLDLANLWRGAVGGLVLAAATFAADRIGRYNVSIHQTVTPGVGSGSHAGTGLPSAVLNGVDLAGRFNQFGVVWDDIRSHILLGRGTAAFETLHQVQGVPQHIASLPLFVLDSTGLLGLALFTAFVVAVLARAWRSRGNEVAMALGQVGLVLAITNLSTETMELMVGWFLIGLLMAASDAAERQRTPATG